VHVFVLNFIINHKNCSLMKKLFTLLFLFSLTTLAISQDHIVQTVGNSAFTPTDLTITVGQTVEWQNTGGNHNVNGTTATYPNNPESFGNSVSSGWTFQHTFMTTGTYDYQCDPHVGLGMVGTVTVMPVVLPAYSIGLVTGDSDMDGVADSVGVECTLTGIVHGVDLDGNAGISFTIIDAAGDGIGLFSFSDVSSYVVTEGDEITIEGTIDSYASLAQITPDLIILNSAGNTLSTVADVTTLDESTESQLVRLTNVTLVDIAQWTGAGSGFNVDVTDGTNTYTVRVDADVTLFATSPPMGAFNIIGIGGQRDFDAPFSDGYQLLPRYIADLEIIVAVNSDLMITGVTDPQGANGSGGTAFGPRAIELYAIDDIADLSIYGIGSANNGGGTDGIEFTFPAIAVTAGSCITLADSTFEAKFTSFFGVAPTILVPGNVTGINGDDAMELFLNGDVVDVFGDINVDGSGQAWEYTDGWAYRKNATGPDGSTFVQDNWTYSGTDALQSTTDSVNTLFADPFPLCSYSTMPPTNLVANDDNFTVDFNTATNLDVLVNDQTPNAIIMLAAPLTTTSGTITTNGTTDLTYTPNMDFCGTDQFTYEVCDANSCETAIVNITVTCPGTSPLIIAGVADPQPSDGDNGNTAGPKMIELYVLEDIADLSIYGVGAANNGGGSDGIEFTFPAVSASAGDCITYTDSLNATNFEIFFGFSATFLVPSGGVSASGINGDDAIELFENGVVVDVFGDPNVDGTGTAWDYVDGWAYRNFGEGPNQGTFDETKWSYSGPDALEDNTNTMNAQYANPFPTCTYALTAPPSYGIYDIGLVTADSDGNGVGDSLDVLVELTGVVYGIDMQGNDNIQFTIIDGNNDGISIFSSNNFGYTVTEGDELTIQGTINQFNGLTQISPDALTVNSSGNTLFDPTDITALGEETESQLVRFENMTLVDPAQWTGAGTGFNVDITDGINIFSMRIDNDIELYSMPLPTGDLFNITGLGGQFDSSDPWTEGYQLLPRYAADIEGFVSTINPELGSKIKFYPNPTSDVLQIRADIQLDNIRITNMLGQQVAELQNPNLSENVNVNNWTPGIYVITFISGNEVWTSQFVKQ
jgi:plastocyanin/DNA/RNA endonuclease YhcR with UshA esterase domain